MFPSYLIITVFLLFCSICFRVYYIWCFYLGHFWVFLPVPFMLFNLVSFLPGVMPLISLHQVISWCFYPFHPVSISFHPWFFLHFHHCFCPDFFHPGVSSHFLFGVLFLFYSCVYILSVPILFPTHVILGVFPSHSILVFPSYLIIGVSLIPNSILFSFHFILSVYFHFIFGVFLVFHCCVYTLLHSILFFSHSSLVGISLLFYSILSVSLACCIWKVFGPAYNTKFW